MQNAIDKRRREWSSTGPKTTSADACQLDMNGKSLTVLKLRLKQFHQTLLKMFKLK